MAETVITVPAGGVASIGFDTATREHSITVRGSAVMHYAIARELLQAIGIELPESLQEYRDGGR